MAGIDKDIEGEARPQPDIKIGYLPQEPQLNPNTPFVSPLKKRFLKWLTP